jgi:hypothetical protein
MFSFRHAQHLHTIKQPLLRQLRQGQSREASSSRPKQQGKAAGLALWLPQAARAWTVAKTQMGPLLLH